MKCAYCEVQYFPWWVYLIFALVVGLITWLILRGSFSPKLGPVMGGFLIVIVVIAMMTLRMTTSIGDRTLTVSYGWIPVLEKTILLSDIQEVQVCSYHPLKQFGGWGWRYGRDGTHALTAKGTQGVCFRLQDGRKFVVGSSKSRKLADTVRLKHVNQEVDQHHE